MGYVGIGEGFKLEAVTARQFMLMNHAFHTRFGVDIRVTWATRDSAEQIRLLNKYYRRTKRNTGKWWDGSYWEKRPGMTTTVATPGTSRHERGYAADVRSFEWSYNRQMAEWARTNASLYGFAFNVSGEPWHIDRVVSMRITSGRQRALGTAESTVPKPSTVPAAPRPSAPATPAPDFQLPGKDDDMLVIIANSKGYVAVRGGGWNHQFPNQASYKVWREVMEKSGHKLPEVLTVADFTFKAVSRAVG